MGSFLLFLYTFHGEEVHPPTLARRCAVGWSPRSFTHVLTSIVKSSVHYVTSTKGVFMETVEPWLDLPLYSLKPSFTQ